MLVLAWSPDGKYIATGDQTDGAFLGHEDRPGFAMSGYPDKVRGCRVDQRGRYLATGGGPIVCVWECSARGRREQTAHARGA